MQRTHLERVESNEAAVEILQAADLENHPIRAICEQIVEVVVALIKFVDVFKHDFDNKQIFLNAVDHAEHMLSFRCLTASMDGDSKVMSSNLGWTIYLALIKL